MSITRNGSGAGTPGAPGIGVPTGGTTGQVLAKASGTDYDTHWADDQVGTGGSGGTQVKVDGANVTTLPISSAAVTPDDIGAIAKSLGLAKGDLLVYTASGALARLAKGADGTVLTADSTTTTGLRWA